MKRYKITYVFGSGTENIVITILAKNYEEACMYAKTYRKESFMIEECKKNGTDAVKERK